MSKQNELAQLADAVTVDGGNVGIGVVPESSYPDRPVLRIGSGLGLMCRASGNPSHTWINSNAYQDPSSADDKYIATDEASQIRQTNGSIHFMTAESGSANSTISWTNAMSVMKTGGITFNGDTAAANALNDYEEGTFTVGFQGATVSAGNTTALYTKIGDLVTWYWYSSGTNISSASGPAFLTGLPFTVLNTNNNYNPVVVAHNTFFGGSTSTGQHAYHLVGDTRVAFNTIGQANNPSFVNSTNKALMVHGSYKTAS